MTIANRNAFFKVGILVSLGLILFAGIGCYYSLARHSSLIQQAVRRPPGLLEQLIIHRFFSPVSYIPLFTLSAAALYADVSLILIYYYFEKTQAPEILFVAFFAFSFSFEAIRLMVPLQAALEAPGLYLILAFRTLLFGRYFGLFSLFAAGVCAAGLEMQKQGTIIIVITVAALVIALGVPREENSWDTALCLVNGYQSLLNLVSIGITLITIASFFVAAYARGSAEYRAAGAGALLACIGRGFLLNADTWLAALPGLAALSFGTWLIGKELRRIYLWL
ncbi:MAG: hypothetical protein LBD37_10365 [Treponema sp.]|jgi:hypothetical protein|nr:hypothetical protein [Treponema sp.]